jgi:hypothetical protein
MPAKSQINVSDILRRGGEQRIALLRYCVMSVAMEPVFVFLAGEYRLRPTHAGALALYDLFCAADAPTRIQTPGALPPRSMRLVSAIHSIREHGPQAQLPQPSEGLVHISSTIPSRCLFDPIVDSLLQDPNGRLAQVSSEFDLEITPKQQPPGGKMSPSQRHFLEAVWLPIARPRLVGAGYWQIANIE